MIPEDEDKLFSGSASAPATTGGDAADYDDDAIRSLDSVEHLRLRPGMYIGALGNGDHTEDGIYVLFKEVVDNSIDEYIMGFGRRVIVTLADKTVTATSGAASLSKS